MCFLYEAFDFLYEREGWLVIGVENDVRGWSKKGGWAKKPQPEGWGY
jgi:hypothetical protein